MRTGIQRRNIEQCKQANKESCRANNAYNNTYQLAALITNIKRDVRQQGKCKQKSEHKSNQVGIVVNHR